MCNLKYETNEPVHETETHSQTESRLVVKGMRHGSETDWEFGISRYKLVYIKWVGKVFLYSPGSYTQYPVINHNGKEYEKECTYN